MNRTSLLIALMVPSLLVACGAGNNTVGTEGRDAGTTSDAKNASDACANCSPKLDAKPLDGAAGNSGRGGQAGSSGQPGSSGQAGSGGLPGSSAGGQAGTGGLPGGGSTQPTGGSSVRDGGAPDVAGSGVSCISDSMCGADEFCHYVPCLIETGRCKKLPTSCPDLTVAEPVCGCVNQKQYSSSCEAEMARVSYKPGKCQESSDAGSTGGVTLIASLRTTTDVYIQATWKNDSKESIFLYGCGTVDVWKHTGVEWKNMGKLVACTWEGVSPEVPAGTSLVDDSPAYGPVLKAWGAGTYRVKGTYGVGCTNPSAGQSKAGCTAFYDAVSNEVVVSAPPASADAGIDAACGPAPNGVTCRKPTGGCVAMICNNGSWSCAAGQTPVGLTPGACDLPDGAAGSAPVGTGSIETIDVYVNDGNKNVMTLPQPIQVPISQEDAELVRDFVWEEGNCGCSGELVLKEGTWTSSCCEAYPDCSIKIDQNTGAVTCALYG